MRQDLDKVIYEHERYGSKRRFKEVRRNKRFNLIDDDGFVGGRESMRKRYHAGWRVKESAINLNILHKIIRDNFGRKWDDVYSEIRAVIDPRSSVGHMILHQLHWIIRNNSVIVGEDGNLWAYPRYRNPQSLENAFIEYYVDPRDGTLQRNKAYCSWDARKKENARRIKEERFLSYRNHKSFAFVKDNSTGIWFKYDYKTIPRFMMAGSWKVNLINKRSVWTEQQVPGQAYDEMLGRNIEWCGSGHYRDRHKDCPLNTVHVNKKTASKKEIKKFQLT